MKSLSARRAWIEIQVRPIIVTSRPVALRKESVDRNVAAHVAVVPLKVALRKESVDRNYAVCADYHKRRLVALRKESVDRNPLPRSATVKDT